MFIAFEGIDGAGKSTQMLRLAAALRESGRVVTTCRDPGSTPLGEALRGLVVEGKAAAVRSQAEDGREAAPPDALRIGGRAEMLIFMAARAQMVEQVIGPALDRGEVVLSDRFLLSNVCYQGHGGGLPVQDLWEVGKVACHGRLPDLSFVFDLPVADAMARVLRPLDRMEQKGAAYLERVRSGFLKEAAADPEHVEVVSAALPPDEIFADLLMRLAKRKTA